MKRPSVIATFPTYLSIINSTGKEVLERAGKVIAPFVRAR